MPEWIAPVGGPPPHPPMLPHPGSPHIVTMCVWALLAALTILRYRSELRDLQRLLLWAFGMGAVCQAVMAVHPYLVGGRGGPRALLPIPIFEESSTHVQAAILIGAFLHLLGDSPEPARTYIRFSVAATTTVALAVIVAKIPPHPHPAT